MEDSAKLKSEFGGILGSGIPIIICTYALVAIAYAWFALEMSKGVTYEKEIDSFEDFYPFYIGQHTDQTCRRLHFVGTTLFLAIAIYNYIHIPALLVAVCAGLQVFSVTRHYGNGLIEMLCVFAIYGTTVAVLARSVRKAVMPMIIAYTFAWIGHFFFELNRPATFIYPTYSLLGDFRMWYEIATVQRDF
jgi:hypothetical protein